MKTKNANLVADEVLNAKVIKSNTVSEEQAELITDVPCSVPPAMIDNLARFDWLVIVAAHDAVATYVQLATLVTWQDPAVITHHLRLGVRHHDATTRHALLQRRMQRRLKRYRTIFSGAV